MHLWENELPVSPARMELQDQKLFLKRDVSTSNIRTKIVEPPQSATLPRSFQPYEIMRRKVI